MCLICITVDFDLTIQIKDLITNVLISYFMQ